MISEINSCDKEIYIWNNLEDYGTENGLIKPYNNKLIQDEFILWYTRTLEKGCLQFSPYLFLLRLLVKSYNTW